MYVSLKGVIIINAKWHNLKVISVFYLHSILSAEVVDATAIPYVASIVSLTQSEPLQPETYFLKF